MSFQPVSSSQRIELLDLLRGFALFGILMVNMSIFCNPHTIMFGNFSIWQDPESKAATWFIRFFFEGKFYVLFSLLFGMGFQLFLQKIDESREVLPLYRRRLMILLLFGALHVVFLWFGDILVWYALFGFVMTWFRKKSNRTLLTWSLVFMFIPVVAMSILMLLMEMARNIPEAAENMATSMAAQQQAMKDLTSQAYTVYANGSFAEQIRFRLTEYANLLGGIIFFYPNTLAMFLLGMIFMRKGMLTQPALHKSFFKKLLTYTLPVGLAGAYILASYSPQISQSDPGWLNVLVMFSHTQGGTALALSYLALIVMCSQANRFGWLRQKLASTGRMALTNYLMQSIIVTTLCFSYGLGLYGKVSPLQGIFISLTIYIIQLFLSDLWLKRFRYGPMEWLWRSLTYGKRLGFRKAPPAISE
ncbi:MAG: DUF418 domain-containing protein [Bacteroidales bacterium]|nr:DUF418 domain-containing protein [Bacteroidales bacterium]